MKKFLSTLIVISIFAVTGFAGTINSPGYTCVVGTINSPGVICTPDDDDEEEGRTAVQSNKDSAINFIKTFITEYNAFAYFLN